MNVHLTPALEKLVEGKVASGRYDSASEVVREALRLLEEKDEFRAAQLRELQRRIDKGIGEADGGEVADGDAFVQGLLDGLDADRSDSKAG